MTILTQPLWYWALLLVCVVVLGCFLRSAKLTVKHLPRRTQLVIERAKRRHEDLYWTFLRDVEALYACTVAMERAVREHPDRVAALISEGVPLHDACEAVA